MKPYLHPPPLRVREKMTLRCSFQNKLLEVLEFKSHEEEEQLTEFLGPRNSLRKKGTPHPHLLSFDFHVEGEYKIRFGKRTLGFIRITGGKGNELEETVS